jgi:hypothetical protein
MDKNYFTAPPDLPPQHIRALLSELTCSALAYKAGSVDASGILATLKKLMAEPYYRNQLDAEDSVNSARSSATFIQLIKYDLANTCHWWEEGWRFESSWQTIENIGLPSGH